MVDSPMTIQVNKNFSDVQVPLRQLNPDTPHKILGVLTEPADTNIAQVRELKEKCSTWNKKMIASALTNRQNGCPIL